MAELMFKLLTRNVVEEMPAANVELDFKDRVMGSTIKP